MRRSVALISGARPNFVKIKPIYEALRKLAFDVDLLHTGQHYDYEMNTTFWKQLGLPTPDFQTSMYSIPDREERIYETAQALRKYMVRNKCLFAVVVGDVDSSRAGAIAAQLSDMPCVHYEAGLRSHDMSMPEEENRKIIDSLSQLLLVTEEDGMTNLWEEGFSDRAHLVGNVMMDTLRWAVETQLTDIAPVLDKYGVEDKKFVLTTLHRPALVDDFAMMQRTVDALESIDMPVVWAAHPRVDMVHATSNILVTAPMDYLTFVTMQLSAACVVTDSGGVQEETTWLGTPCLTYRENTERPSTCTYGTNRVVGVNPDDLPANIEEAVTEVWREIDRPPLWDGYTGPRIGHTIGNWWMNEGAISRRVA